MPHTTHHTPHTATPHHTIPHIMPSTTPHHTTPHHTTSHHTTPHHTHTTPHHTTPHHTTPHHTTPVAHPLALPEAARPMTCGLCHPLKRPPRRSLTPSGNPFQSSGHSLWQSLPIERSLPLAIPSNRAVNRLVDGRFAPHSLDDLRSSLPSPCLGMVSTCLLQPPGALAHCAAIESQARPR
jgi:hypothetical protein